MLPLVEYTLDLFGFTRYEAAVALVAFMSLMLAFLGGLVTNIMVAYAGPRRPRAPMQRLSVRLLITLQVILVVFAAYYHGALLGGMRASHFVFWVATVISANLIAYIGAQISYLLHEKRIERNRQAYRAWAKKRMMQMEHLARLGNDPRGVIGAARVQRAPSKRKPLPVAGKAKRRGVGAFVLSIFLKPKKPCAAGAA